MKTKINLYLVISLLFAGSLIAQKSYSDEKFKVKIDFNRWHDLTELYSDMKRLQEAFPKFLRLESIGKSYLGRDIMAMTINNPSTGAEENKAAIYIDGNMHGNEIQGGEVCLYTIWYLMENYNRLDKIKNLVDKRVFYILPCVNPDGRQSFMETDGNNSRSGRIPIDDDNDGICDEDGYDDLNNNGVIEQIIKFTPGQGTHIKNINNPEILEEVPYGKKGDYILLGYEGIDNDGDGMINEDAPGYYDPNRDWGSGWQPSYIQTGARDYPFQLPESRALASFLIKKKNIASLQTYHNAGGMILRGPGSKTNEYPEKDIEVYNEIGEKGELILPFYKYMLLWRDLYTVHGGYIDWTNDALGIPSLTNELWNTDQYFTSQELKEKTKDPQNPVYRRNGQKFFDDYLEFGEHIREFTEFNHPQFGKVEIGGASDKLSSRIPPRFMSEEMCHRNMAFTLYVAEEMPEIELGNPEIKKIDENIYRIRVGITNPHLIPTIMEKAALNGVVRPDILHFEGKADIISASWIENIATYDYLKPVSGLIDQKELNRILIRNGQPGRTTRTIQYFVKGSGNIKITYDSVKGGKTSKDIILN